jgi:hypothetical protein
MPEYAGSLQRLVLSRTLWLILVGPAVGAIWQLVVERRRAAGDARRSAMFSLVLAAGTTAAHVVILARLPHGGRALLEPIAGGAHIGQLDASLALWFDPIAAAGALLACMVALVAALLAPGRVARESGWRAWAWIQVTLEAALIAFLADGFVTTAIGWSLAALSAAWLAGWTDADAARVAATRGAVAIGALMVGAVLFFWGLGGAWEGDDFVPDVQPRFVAARAGAATARTQGGTVTLTGAAGALVFVDDARRDSLRAPFVRVPVQGGSHGFRIHRGVATEDAVVPRVSFDGGDEIALVPIGPTLTFRTIADQLALRDRHAVDAIKRSVESRQGPGGLPLVVAALAAWFVAAAAMSASPVPRGAPPVLAAAACGFSPSLLGPVFLARVACLVPLAPHAGGAISWLGVAVLFAGAMRARKHGGAAQRFLAFAGAIPGGVSCVALGSGGEGALLEAMMASGVAAAGLHLVASQRPDWSEGRVPRGETLAESLLLSVPERLAGLVASMERWVVEALASAVATLARAGAWTVATADANLVSTPADSLALRVTRAARRGEPVVGASLGRVVWALLGLAGFAALLHAVWPSR